MVTRRQFAELLLADLGYEKTRENMVALIAWMAAEGSPQTPQAKFNPMNTTLWMPGCTNFNWVPVRNYLTLEDGVEATKRTLLGQRVGYYGIRQGLKRGKNAEKVLRAVEASSWGTGGLALQIVNDVRRDFDTRADIAIGQ